MTRKHFEMIAKAIRSLPPEFRRALAENLADQLAKENPRFDRKRFIAACQ
jgi:hypothetical protein